MRKGWLIATVLGGTAAVAQGADVRIFGISTPQTGQWAVYAQITNTASTAGGGAIVSGLSSIGISVIDTGGAAVSSAVNTLPRGNTPYVDSAPPFDTDPLSVRYGFWLPFKKGVLGPSNGTLGAEPVATGGTATGRTGAFGIAGAQDPFSDTAGIPYNRLVLPGVGVSRGATVVNGDFSTATQWSAPVQVATGTYTPPTPNSAQGLKIEYFTDTVNLIRDTDPGAGVAWTLESAVSTSVVNARTYTGVTIPIGSPGNTTVKAGLGDANLDGTVDFNDLVTLAQNYNVISGMSWFSGDFNFDGAVDFNDLVLLAQNYNQPVPSDSVPASFNGDWALARSSVPEPSMTVLGVGVATLTLRRRRK